MNIANFPSFEGQKQWLLDQIEYTTSLWEKKAIQHPDDLHNASCAKILLEVANTVRALPATHDLFQRMEKIETEGIALLQRWREEVNHVLSRAGSDTQKSAEDVLNELISYTERTTWL